MTKLDILRILEGVGDDAQLIIPSKDRVNGYSVFSDNVEIIKDNIKGSEVLVVRERRY